MKILKIRDQKGLFNYLEQNVEWLCPTQFHIKKLVQDGAVCTNFFGSLNL